MNLIYRYSVHFKGKISSSQRQVFHTQFSINQATKLATGLHSRTGNCFETTFILFPCEYFAGCKYYRFENPHLSMGIFSNVSNIL